MRAVETPCGGRHFLPAPSPFARDQAGGLRKRKAQESSKHALAQIGATRPLPLGRGRILSDAELFLVAKKAKSESKAKVSGFKVGAAAITETGRVLSAHNLEITDRLAIGTCAESSIAFQLRDESLRTLLITSDSECCIAPCGGCRQTLLETAPSNARIIMTSASGEKVETTVGALLPMPTELTDASALKGYAKAIERAQSMFTKADTGGRKIARHGAVIVDDDGSMHGGVTRKQCGTLSLAVQMAADARFLSGTKTPPKVVVIVGNGEGAHGLPVPTGRERQELFNMGPKTPVLLVSADTGAASLTTAETLLPFAYAR